VQFLFRARASVRARRRLSSILSSSTPRGDAGCAHEGRAEKLAAKLPASAHLVAPDETGRREQRYFAARLRRPADPGTRDLAFIIGGPDGLMAPLRIVPKSVSRSVRRPGRMLVRAMLAEQVYRATIPRAPLNIGRGRLIARHFVEGPGALAIVFLRNHSLADGVRLKSP
jgi:23S rRNA pseudoU1915 N3-methylase RlmH